LLPNQIKYRTEMKKTEGAIGNAKVTLLHKEETTPENERRKGYGRKKYP